MLRENNKRPRPNRRLPRWDLPIRVGLGLFYSFWALTLDLHHNHGVPSTPEQPTLARNGAATDPCPVDLFQNAHGQACTEAVPAVVLPEAPAPRPIAKRVACVGPRDLPRLRGPPRLG